MVLAVAGQHRKKAVCKAEPGPAAVKATKEEGKGREQELYILSCMKVCTESSRISRAQFGKRGCFLFHVMSKVLCKVSSLFSQSLTCFSFINKSFVYIL